MIRSIAFILSLIVIFINPFCFAQKIMLDKTLHSLRHGDSREWSEFPVMVAENHFSLRFDHQQNVADQTLYLRQYDVKQTWRVNVNTHDIGMLVADEKDMITYFNIPKGILRNGENHLTIRCTGETPDDIRLGEVTLDTRPLNEVLTEATLDLNIVDDGTNVSIPGRITVVNLKGVLQTFASSTNGNLAIRPGYAYTGNGQAQLQLPAGTYTLYAGRGFEYGIDSARVTLHPGDRVIKTFRIKREVDTHGWINSDTHIHTVTYSGHGDATREERAITIAGEGIELPILTDHNIYVDLKPVAEAAGMLTYFTPVTGDELTTKVGHFNIFPVTTGAPVFDYKVQNWSQISASIQDKTNDKIIVLNHARDIHNDFRPFGPVRHLSGAGVSADDWNFPANAMEVINSGSQQSDFMNLYHDWFGMLNRGYFLTPIGSSDSHDVSRYTVGQGRTYIQSAADDPTMIDVQQLMRNLREGRVMVCSGLLTKMIVNNQYGPGELVPGADRIDVALEVDGPQWTRAERITLYMNGVKIREEKINNGAAAGIKWKGTWSINTPAHDVFLVAIAEGPGDKMPYWPIAKPYQPSNPDWHPKVVGSTGAVWIDADKNGRRNAANGYAVEILKTSNGDINEVIELLKSFDEAVAMQVAALLWKEGKRLNGDEISNALKGAAPATKSGFDRITKEISQIRK